MRDVSEQLTLAKNDGIVTRNLVVWLDGRDKVIQPETPYSKIIAGVKCYYHRGYLFPDRAGDTFSIIAYTPSLSQCRGFFTDEVNNQFFYMGVDYQQSNLYSIYYSSSSGKKLPKIKAIEFCGKFLYSGTGNDDCPKRMAFLGEYQNDKAYKASVLQAYDEHPVSGGNNNYDLFNLNRGDHFVITNNTNNDKASVYYNGVLKSQNEVKIDNDTTSNLILSDGSNNAGGYTTYPANSTHVMIGAIRFYTEPLTSKQVLQNYNYEKSIGRAN